MKVSVITICFNSVSCIERTIKSVIEQSSDNYEYIIVDGKSTDGTVDIIRKYDSYITKWISEPDNGIYHAMNKGVAMATGEYCIFMNAGDAFFAEDILERVRPHLDGKNAIIMGNQIYVSKNRYHHYGRHWKTVTLRSIFRDSLYHQSSFIKRTDLLNTPYDESLRMVSDWKLAHELLIQQNKSYKGIDINICLFDNDGITNRQVELRTKECREVLDSMYPEKVQSDYFYDEINYKRWWNVTRYIVFAKRKYNQLRFRMKYSKYVSARLAFLQAN